MGFLKRLFGGGDEREREELRHAMQRVTPHDGRTPSDEQAIERYRYLLRTAPPEAIEQAHERSSHYGAAASHRRPDTQRKPGTNYE